MNPEQLALEALGHGKRQAMAASERDGQCDDNGEFGEQDEVSTMRLTLLESIEIVAAMPVPP